ncbi:MAG: HD family hydrolase [Rhodobacteraceae bacterium]|nr:MAG: HD family hydrolase [Paracoccaceae bacterium]
MAKAPRAWQRMLSGRRLDLLDPSPLDVEIEDIAHGLARVARWNGQTSGDWPFSVAEHSLLVERLLDATPGPPPTVRERLTALLHDAPEYVIGDMISPFKAALGLDYKAFEARLATAVHIRFGLPPTPAAALLARIKKADRASAYLEAVQLAGFAEAEAARFFGRPRLDGALRIVLRPAPPAEATTAFLERFAALSAPDAP